MMERKRSGGEVGGWMLIDRAFQSIWGITPNSRRTNEHSKFMYGDYSNDDGRWRRKRERFWWRVLEHMWRIVVVIVLIAVGLFLARNSAADHAGRSQETHGSDVSSISETSNGGSEQGSGSTGLDCVEDLEGVFRCGPLELYEKIREVKQWHGIYTVPMQVTAFNSVPEQTDSTPCISADGTDICEEFQKGNGVCAAALPFGTVLRIQGWGDCTVHDRLSPKYSHRIDLHFGGRDRIGAAKRWGIRRLEVTVID